MAYLHKHASAMCDLRLQEISTEEFVALMDEMGIRQERAAGRITDDSDSRGRQLRSTKMQTLLAPTRTGLVNREVNWVSELG